MRNPSEPKSPFYQSHGSEFHNFNFVSVPSSARGEKLMMGRTHHPIAADQLYMHENQVFLLHAYYGPFSNHEFFVVISFKIEIVYAKKT